MLPVHEFKIALLGYQREQQLMQALATPLDPVGAHSVPLRECSGHLAGMEVQAPPRPHTPMLVFIRGKVLTGLLALSGGLAAPAVLAQELYVLNTTCSTPTSEDFVCQVQAVDVDDTTEYRHRFGTRTVTYRMIDDPYVRIEGRAYNSAPWTSVKNAMINFKTEELCFNSKAFCVNNPTFLADVLIQGGDGIQGRTQVGMAFADNGRVDVACFDNGCDRLMEAIKQ